jgi:outer membrane lipoprotein LolB
VDARSAPSFLLLLLLSGCALQRPGPATRVNWEERRAQLLQLARWEARGRIAVKTGSGGGQGDLQWDQSGSDSRIRVSGPFGAGAYEIHWTPEALTVVSRNGEFRHASSGADATTAFLHEQLGWSFPAASVRFWLLGLRDPAAPGEERFDAAGELTALQQGGWSVVYQRFADVEGQRLPTRITLEGVDARVRLVIDTWDLR